MSNISIKDVPEDWAEALRLRAARNHRSLQGELMALLEQAVQQEAPTHAANNVASGAGLKLPRPTRGGKRIDEVVAELRQKYPQPPDPGPSSIELVRAERDAR